MNKRWEMGMKMGERGIRNKVMVLVKKLYVMCVLRSS